jgi:vanillate O-demethylase ferredoxin subunit
VTCESSCEAGVCGTCELGYTYGEPEHNDQILSEDGRRDRVLVCCARVREGLVVLDL